MKFYAKNFFKLLFTVKNIYVCTNCSIGVSADHSEELLKLINDYIELHYESATLCEEVNYKLGIYNGVSFVTSALKTVDVDKIFNNE